MIMGLFDSFNPEFLTSPAGQGLLGAFGAATTPSPVRPGLGQVAMAGMDQYNVARKAKQLEDFQKQQMMIQKGNFNISSQQHMLELQKMKEAARLQAIREEEIAKLPPEAQQAIRLGAKVEDFVKPTMVGEGQKLVVPGFGKEPTVIAEGGTKARPMRRVIIGSEEVDQEFTPEGWKEIGRGPRFNPQGDGNRAPYFQALQTPEGIFKFNARTGGLEPALAGGKPVIGSTSSVPLQGALAEAKSGGKVAGEDATKTQIGLPTVLAQGEEAIRLADELLTHPGMKQAVGGSSLTGVQYVPGTKAHDFSIRLNQIKGKQFLQAYETLKGGGQITEIEGQKATDAMSRMNSTGSEKEFEKATREFQQVIRNGMNRAKMRANSVKSYPATQFGNSVVDSLLEKYK